MVVKKGEFDDIVDIASRFKNIAQTNPVYFAAALVSVLFFVLFLMGSVAS